MWLLLLILSLNWIFLLLLSLNWIFHLFLSLHWITELVISDHAVELACVRHLCYHIFSHFCSNLCQLLLNNLLIIFLNRFISFQLHLINPHLILFLFFKVFYVLSIGSHPFPNSLPIQDFMFAHILVNKRMDTMQNVWETSI